MKPEFTNTRLSRKSRFALAAVIYGITALLQAVTLAGGSVSFFVRWGGCILLAVPLYVLAVKNFSNKPSDVGKEEWKPVSMTEIDRVNDQITKMRTAAVPAIYGKNAGVAFLVVAAFFALFSLVGANYARMFIIIDLYLMFTPWLWFGRVEKWYPQVLSKRLKEFTQITTYNWSKNVKLVPFLRFDEDRLGLKLPEDFKVMAEPAKHKPEDFIGAQFQLTYNNGPNGSVPYMYAVFITKERGSSWNKLRSIQSRNFVTDAGSDGEFGTVVIRLDPDCRSDGYHTKTSDIDKLIGIVAEGLGKL